MADFNGTAIDKLLSGAVAGGALAGAVMVVGDREQTLYEGAVGELPDGTRTIFRIASDTPRLLGAGVA